jgi:hypothetical protein
MRLNVGGDTRNPCNGGVGFIRRASARPLRAGLVNLHSGGSGAPPVRHYDRSARSLLKGDGGDNAPSQEARPGAGVEFSLRHKCRMWSAVRRGVSIARDAAALSQQRGEYRLRLSAFRSPRFWGAAKKTTARPRRSNNRDGGALAV